MNPFERWSLRVGASLATVTGVVYGWLRYFGGVEGEFGPEPSPWLSFWQHGHVLVVPVLVFALGVALAGHGRAALDGKVRKGRRTGLGLAVVGVPLVLGGYAIQVVMGASTRQALGWLHAGLGALFVLAWLVHWGKRLPMLRRKSSPRAGVELEARSGS
jgi:hypothetical protein